MMEEPLNLCDEQIFQCSICCNNIQNEIDIFQIELCHCRFCKQCVRQYCINQLDTLSIPIRCPNTGCNHLLSLDEIRSLVDNLQFQLYNKLLLDHEVTNDPQRLYCPHVDCGHILIISNKRSMTCTKCQTKICLKCRCQWHRNKRCSNLLKSCEMEIHENIKYCPRCHFLLERVAGCAQIICTNCKHTFCWYCLKSLNNDFFLLHFERGPCRNRLGHSRLSLFLHRLMMLSLIILFIILLIICSPLLILLAPLLICFRYKQLKTYFNKLMKWEQPLPTTHQSSDHIEQSTRNPLIVSSLDIDKSLSIYDV